LRYGVPVHLEQLTKVHDVVSANRAIVYDNIPSPKRDGVPLLQVNMMPRVYMNRAALRTLLGKLSYLLDLKLLLSFDTLASSAIGLLDNGARSIAHLDIGHVGRSWSWCQLLAVAGRIF
jgi:hypothetical protein